ncbi:MAG: hypothetical protein K6G11_07805, partial [Lachnospiraceae bacterium]|nr:hypothetical protein [Lachnospiraceae bacterium]
MNKKMTKLFRKTLSGVLSLAMVCSLVDMQEAKAVENTLTKSETDTVLTIGNSFVKLSVNKNTGGYTLKTVEGDVLTKTDNNKRLLYSPEGEDTSFSTIRVDGEDYVYGEVDEEDGNSFITEPYISGESVISTYHIGEKNVNVTQTIELLMDSKDDKLGSVQISYEVENKGSTDVESGLRMVLDTCLGSQDYAVYEMASNTENGTYEQFTKAHEFSKSEIATEFRAIDNNYAPRVAAYGYMDDSTGKPDSMIFGHWFDMASCGWKYEVDDELSLIDNNNQDYATADSAVALYWNPDNVKAGEKANYSFYYGINANNNVTENSTMQVSVNADKDAFVLEKDEDGNVKSSYKDNTLKLQVKVSNTLPASEFRDNVVVALTVDEDYLQVNGNDVTADSEGLASEEDEGKNIIHITNFETGQTKVINWTVQVKKLPETIRYLQYAVKVYPGSADKNDKSYSYLDDVAFCSAKGKVLAPGSSGEKPKVSIYNGTPKFMYYKGNRNFVVRGEGFDILTDKSAWDLEVMNLSTGDIETVDSSMISFNSDKTAMIVRFTDEMIVGRYQLTIKPGTTLTTSEIGLPESITSDNMIFNMSDDPDLVNPPVGAVAIKQVLTNGSYEYQIETMDPSKIDDLSEEYLLTITGNLYQTKDDGESDFIPITGDGSQTQIIINKIMSFSGEEFSVDYTYNDAGERDGVIITLNGDTGIVGASDSMWEYESVIELKNGKNYSLDPDALEETAVRPVKIIQKGIAGTLQKISGFIFDLNCGVFNKREIDGEMYNTLSLGGRMGLGFLTTEDYDGVSGAGAELNVEDVRYGEKTDGTSGLIGVKAEGQATLSRFIEAIPAGAEGELSIDTIDHIYQVGLEGEMELATFEAEYELEIIASKHGVPVPNVLKLKVGGIEPGAPIVPPVVYMHGGKGQVDGLYSLFYPGETEGWPDTEIGIGGEFSIADVLQGWLNMDLGTRRARLSGTSISVAEMNLFKEISGTFNWYDPVSFEFVADLEIFSVIRGGVTCKVILLGDDGPDLDISGRVAVVIPNVLLGKDYTIAGVALGGNKSGVYGSATLLGVDLSFDYKWGGSEESLQLDTLDVPVTDKAKNNATMGISNARCEASTEEDVNEKAKVAPLLNSNNILTAKKNDGLDISIEELLKIPEPTEAEEAEINVDEDGKLIVRNVTGTSDRLLKVYYDMKSDEDEELKASQVKVAIDENAKNIVGIECDENNVATNMDEANIGFGEDDKGKFILLSFTADELDGMSEIAVYSDYATFSYAQLYKLGKVPCIDSVNAYFEQSNLFVDVNGSNLDNVEGTKTVYFSKTKDGAHDYTVVELGVNDEISDIEVPSKIPSGDYYVTVAIDGTLDGVNCHCEKVTGETVQFINNYAPTNDFSGEVASIGNGEVRIKLVNIDENNMDGVYVEAYELDENNEKNGNVIEQYVAIRDMIEGSFNLRLNPKEEGTSYEVSVYPANQLEGESVTKNNLAIGLKSVTLETFVSYPNPAKISVGYTEDYIEENVSLASDEETSDDSTSYINKVFTEVDSQGIGMKLTSDKPVVAKVYIDDTEVNDITTFSTALPVIKLTDADGNPLKDGEHKIKIVAENEYGDTSIFEDSIKIDTAYPLLQVYTPQAGDGVSDKVNISGITDSDVNLTLYIDKEKVSLDDLEMSAGSFNATVSIPDSGKKFIIHDFKLIAEDAYGRTTIYNTRLNTSKDISVKKVFIKADGEETEEGERLYVYGKDKVELKLFALTEEGEELEFPSDMITFESMSDEDQDLVTIDDEGLVTITGESTLAVSAKYQVTDDYCYQANVIIDSYEEKLSDKDAEEPVVVDENESMINASKGENVTFTLDASVSDGGEITIEWFEKAGDGEFIKVGEGDTFTATPDGEYSDYEYYAAVTNEIRSTGLDTAITYTEIKKVHIRAGASIDDLVITGETDEEGAYTGSISIKAKDEDCKVGLAEEAEFTDEIVLDNLLDGEQTITVVIKDAAGYETEAITWDVSVKNAEARPSLSYEIDGESLEDIDNAYKNSVNVNVKVDSKDQEISKLSYTVVNGKNETGKELSNVGDFNIEISDRGLNIIKVTAVVGDKEYTGTKAVKIYKSPELDVTFPEQYTYNGLEYSGFEVNKGTSGGELKIYSKGASDDDYKEELPVNVGAYSLKFTIAQDDANYYLADEFTADITIDKARQKVTFTKDTYEGIIGETLVISVGGIDISDIGEVKISSSDENVASVDSASIAYDAESRVVTIPVNVKEEGSAALTLEIAESDNYMKMVKTCYVQGVVGASETHPYTINGTRGHNSWFKSVVTIEPMEGYTVNDKADGKFKDSYAINKEGASVQPEKLYFKDADDNVTEYEIEDISIDTVAPEAELKANESGFKSFLNTITFGLFFKDTVEVQVSEKSDEISSIDKVLYYKSSKALSIEKLEELGDNEWSDKAITIEPDSKAVVYALITDMAGNKTYLSTDGIIADHTEAVLTITSDNDLDKWITDSKAVIHVETSDNLAGIKEVSYKVDDADAVLGSESFDITDLEDGEHLIVITVEDNSGNITTQTVSVKQDLTIPTVELNKTEGENKLEVICNVGASGVAKVVLINDGEEIDITDSYTEGVLISENGKYEVRVTNGAGIVSSKTIEVTDI